MKRIAFFIFATMLASVSALANESQKALQVKELKLKNGMTVWLLT